MLGFDQYERTHFLQLKQEENNLYLSLYNNAAKDDISRDWMRIIKEDKKHTAEVLAPIYSLLSLIRKKESTDNKLIKGYLTALKKAFNTGDKDTVSSPASLNKLKTLPKSKSRVKVTFEETCKFISSRQEALPIKEWLRFALEHITCYKYFKFRLSCYSEVHKHFKSSMLAAFGSRDAFNSFQAALLQTKKDHPTLSCCSQDFLNILKVKLPLLSAISDLVSQYDTQARKVQFLKGQMESAKQQYSQHVKEAQTEIVRRANELSRAKVEEQKQEEFLKKQQESKVKLQTLKLEHDKVKEFQQQMQLKKDKIAAESMRKQINMEQVRRRGIKTAVEEYKQTENLKSKLKSLKEEQLRHSALKKHAVKVALSQVNIEFRNNKIKDLKANQKAKLVTEAKKKAKRTKILNETKRDTPYFHKVSQVQQDTERLRQNTFSSAAAVDTLASKEPFCGFSSLKIEQNLTTQVCLRLKELNLHKTEYAQQLIRSLGADQEKRRNLKSSVGI